MESSTIEVWCDADPGTKPPIELLSSSSLSAMSRMGRGKIGKLVQDSKHINKR